MKGRGSQRPFWYETHSGCQCVAIDFSGKETGSHLDDHLSGVLDRIGWPSGKVASRRYLEGLMTDQPRIVANVEIERNDFIHNDLSSVSFHLKKRIDAAFALGGDKEGVGLDMMAGVTMLAFTFEAYLNFVGDLKIEGWDADASGKEKRQLIWKVLGLEWDASQRPVSTLICLIKARNMMAHGKPVRIKKEWKAEGTHDELQQQLRNYQTEFEKLITPQFFAMAYEDVDAIWRTLQKAAGIEILETFDTGMSGITFLAHAEQQAS